ncbi:hypothetical protein [Silvimonas sp.]|uniref:hypothetical protein n=1 Tax=Silvimonas sp. TaxID=2650811 RepID=UPI00285196F1|nr:hypothetical protein [Silvimonas sp.]MDR3427961.1 hypothetical protein [Silvimonas sp.]
MNWQILIQTLLGRGLTQQEIADEAVCQQSNISALLHGKRGKRVTWEIGQALIRLEKETRNLCRDGERRTGSERRVGLTERRTSSRRGADNSK